jgi:hypothetical protein
MSFPFTPARSKSTWIAMHWMLSLSTSGSIHTFFIGDAVSAEHISAAHVIIMAEMSIRILIFIVLFL